MSYTPEAKGPPQAVRPPGFASLSDIVDGRGFKFLPSRSTSRLQSWRRSNPNSIPDEGSGHPSTCK